MELLSYGQYVIVTALLLIILSSSCVSSFSTQACTHDEMEQHLRSTLNCIMRSNRRAMDNGIQYTDIHTIKEYKNSTNTPEWCELMDEEIECFTKHLGTCFDKKMTSDFAIWMKWEIIDNNTCNRIKGDNKKEIELNGKDNLKKDIESLKDIVTFDQECSTEELLISLEVLKPCLVMHLFSIIQHTIPLKPTEPKSIPVCKTVVGILNDCFAQTDCLSQTEMNLIRDFLATYYNIFMEFVAQSVAKFGSMSNFMDAAGVDKEKMFDKVGYPLSSQRKTMMKKEIDTVVDDYKVNL